jgi:hypothetical protein
MRPQARLAAKPGDARRAQLARGTGARMRVLLPYLTISRQYRNNILDNIGADTQMRVRVLGGHRLDEETR